MLTHTLARLTRAGLAASIATITLAALPDAAHAEFRSDQVSIVADAPDPLLDACPIAGPSTFEDSWGWARSGGRRHEGVDIIAGRGTPIVAVRDGFAQFKNNRLGGRAIWLTAENGDKFYYAHLDDWEGESRVVEAGELIGYVGSSGNARGSHLHFETLPGGNVENPYPHALGACVPTPAELAAAQRPVNELASRTRGIPAS